MGVEVNLCTFVLSPKWATNNPRYEVPRSMTPCNTAYVGGWVVESIEDLSGYGESASGVSEDRGHRAQA
jgi:hypothetical protein